MANKYLEKIASIDINPKNKGLLHKKMGVPSGKPISMGKLEQEKSRAKKSGNGKLMKEVVFAQNAKKWNHK